MKKYLEIIYSLVCLSILLWSCEGPMGPAGAGGEDINETCKKCHNHETSLTSKFAQISHSKHVSGTAWFEGTRNSCAPCHIKEGFLDVVKNNPANNKYIASASVDFGNPSPIGCGTCHNIHHNYDSTDFELTFTGPVNLLIDTTKNITVNLGTGNTSQLCIKCHQPRIVKQMDFAGAPTTSYSGISNYRWGTHYGTVGAIFAGKGAFQIAGSLAYENSHHTAQAECSTCHMAAQNGLSGGHTFYAKNEETGVINTNGCKTCHTNSTTLATNISSVQTEIKNLLYQLGAKLDLLGTSGGILEKDTYGDYTGYVDIYDPSSNADAKYKTTSTSSLTDAQKTVNNSLAAFPAINNKQAAAIANFQLVIREKSLGIHNYTYTKALLTNTLAAL
jgi:hypothetical protein